MTDKEIIKALECCKKDDCDNCPNDFGNCYANLARCSLDLINRQQAEIKELNTIRSRWIYDSGTLTKISDELYQKIKAKAVKEFAERLKAHTRKMSSSDFSGEFWDKAVLVSDIDNLVKEMVGDTE